MVGFRAELIMLLLSHARCVAGVSAEALVLGQNPALFGLAVLALENNIRLVSRFSGQDVSSILRILAEENPGMDFSKTKDAAFGTSL